MNIIFIVWIINVIYVKNVDIIGIKRKYENEIKLRKLKYEKNIKNINNKYKMIYNKEIILNKNKLKVLDMIYNKNIDNVKNDKKNG